MPSPSSDRNLLFALVAYQNGYITMEQFFEAAQLWNKEPKKDIGDILVERKFLDDVERFNIQGIVEDRLRRQGGLDNSLSFVVENGSVPQGEDLPEEWQKKFTEITKISDDSSKSPASKPKLGPSIHRYIFRRPIGEGGQGIVWEVDDTELGRRIALKKVHPKHANNPLHKGMLIEESRNTGRLDHAGIVPVYDLGQDDEGNPFFTMQLIKGEKLADRVRSIKHETLNRQEFLAQIRPLLRHLIATCNTLQYAYDKYKVIHRDLKPENIMVNRYGETVVMDWGMGKAVEDATQLDEASSMLFVPVSGSGSGVERTQVGSVKGTLGYLSPEQAQALNSNLDHRTDIYGLGATLYRILTGTVPYSGTSVEEALSRAKLNQFVRPREQNSKIPKELEAICLKAMATLPADRYQKATDMGQDLENWIAGEPISVVPDNLLKKSERWLRRHARGVIASLLMLGLTAAALLWATVAILGAKTKVDNLNRSLSAEQTKTKESRELSSYIFDEVVGYIFDDELSRVPNSYEVRKRTLAMAVNRLSDPETGYVTKYPEDWNLKLDLLRLLTRLANLEKEMDPVAAQVNWETAEKLIASARSVSDDNIARDSWRLSESDMQMYYSAFLTEIVRDFETAHASIDRAIEICEMLERDQANDKNIKLSVARAKLQKSSLFTEQKDFEGALKECEYALNKIDHVRDWLVKNPLNSKTAEQIPNETVLEILIYMVAIRQKSEIMKGLNRHLDPEECLKKELEVYEKARQIPLAKTDATRFAIQAITQRIESGFDSQWTSATAQKYNDALKWISQADYVEELHEEVFGLESARIRMIAATDIKTAEEGLIKISDLINKMKPDASDKRINAHRNFALKEIDFLNAQLAVALATGKINEVEQIRMEITNAKSRADNLSRQHGH